MKNNAWMLPEGIDEAGPEQARAIEILRRQCIDRMKRWGYQLIMPPMVEFTESLLTGAGAELELQTLKVIDQLSGRLMGIRADMTPQAARLDARSGQGINRLSYCGSTLQARPARPGDSRAPIQIGAELFGYSGLDADLEVIQLLLELLTELDTGELTLDVGHVALFAEVVAQVDPSEQHLLEQALASKDETLLKQCSLTTGAMNQAQTLLACQGSVECLVDLKKAFPNQADVFEACERIAQVTDGQVNLHFDFAEGRGASYHTGLVFSLYADNEATPIARGGRYDSDGSDFGTPRPATGFSADLRLWQGYMPKQTRPQPISAPVIQDAELAELIKTLRAQGEVIQFDLDGSAPCSRRLVKLNHQWTIENA